ncbi:MAG: DUF4384 domain-containing protein [Leptolyngbyaceae cyanobacterium CSU_1_3]|nr:DUF4384 domain-containing protein [Leptolyngbyaceae cyanobacterium CSU_1_3]
MPSIKRREFLQFTGSALAAIGLSQLDLMQQSDRVAQVLAKDAPRKLALLVGINKYPFKNTLQGCLTDVELQRRLLVHRFGFKLDDILILTDAQATRQNILDAFEKHLIAKAQPDDVVVFHFSGHGSLIADPLCIYKDQDGDCLNATLVPVDNTLSLDDRDKGGVVPDITGRTLFLLMSALKTNNVTVVLDSCHSGGGKRGNIMVRALRGGAQLRANPDEIAYQQRWIKNLKLTPSELERRVKAGVAKGVVVTSASINELAADYPFETNFHAGAFTYTMTQYLWQQTGDESLSRSIANVGRDTKQIARGQTPEFESKPGDEQQPTYFLNQPVLPADAVLDRIEGDQVTLWLGGVNSDNLQSFDGGGVFLLMDAQGKPLGQVQLTPQSRNQLTVKGKLTQTNRSAAVQPGLFLQEAVRGIPSQEEIKLLIGLDPSLGEDQAAIATALQQVNRVEAVPVQKGKVHYLLGRMTPDYRQQLQTALTKKQIAGSLKDLPAVGCFCLFTPGIEEVIPDSAGTVDETATKAIERLLPKFKSLLAARLAKLVLNGSSSRLNVAVSLSRANNPKELAAQTFTVRGQQQANKQAKSLPISKSSTPQFPLSTRIQIQIANNEIDKDLYVSVLVIDASGEMGLIFPNNFSAGDSTTRVAARQTLRIPDRSRGDRFSLPVSPPLGNVEILVLASTQPLRNTLRALQEIASRGERGLGGEPADVVNEIFSDLNRGTRGKKVGGLTVVLDPDVRGIASTQLAAMSITFQSIEA